MKCDTEIKTEKHSFPEKEGKRISNKETYSELVSKEKAFSRA